MHTFARPGVQAERRTAHVRDSAHLPFYYGSSCSSWSAFAGYGWVRGTRSASRIDARRGWDCRATTMNRVASRVRGRSRSSGVIVESKIKSVGVKAPRRCCFVLWRTSVLPKEKKKRKKERERESERERKEKEREWKREFLLLLAEKRDARRSPSRELLFLASVADMSQTSRGRASRVTSRTNCPVSWSFIAQRNVRCYLFIYLSFNLHNVKPERHIAFAHRGSDSRRPRFSPRANWDCERDRARQVRQAGSTGAPGTD